VTSTPGRLPPLAGQRLSLRQATLDDAEALATILAEPGVARWWGRNDAADVRDELRTLPSYAIVIDDAVAGWLQVHEETDPSYPSVAFDIALTTGLHGRGYGAEALRLAVAYFAARGHHRFTIDPAVDIEHAIRCYTRVGFRTVGVMRAYERAADGQWRDGLLMDLLADELVS
jgi:aminoglycoside 6'-N-acetyltransferase